MLGYSGCHNPGYEWLKDRRPDGFHTVSRGASQIDKDVRSVIIATLTGDGFTQDMYQRLRQGVEWDTEPVDGWIVHAVYWDDSGGIHMTNIWESPEHNRAGFATRLGPVMRRIGIPPPQDEVHRTFNVNVFKTVG